MMTGRSSCTRGGSDEQWDGTTPLSGIAVRVIAVGATDTRPSRGARRRQRSGELGELAERATLEEPPNRGRDRRGDRDDRRCVRPTRGSPWLPCHPKDDARRRDRAVKPCPVLTQARRSPPHTAESLRPPWDPSSGTRTLQIRAAMPARRLTSCFSRTRTPLRPDSRLLVNP